MTTTPDVDAGRFTVGVFQDAEAARRVVTTLIGEHAFPRESLSIIAKQSPEIESLITTMLGSSGAPADIHGLGTCVAHGPLIAALRGPMADLARQGIAATMRRVGFQAHDGFIYETLTARGGVLVAVHSEPRAADALSVMFAYGGGNAAIGAWTGRV